MTKHPSRREFILGTAAAVVAANVRGSARQATSLTAGQIVDRVRDEAGVPWRDNSIDGFKAGTADTIVTGIATTVVATIEVLRRAAAAGRNLLIVQEPTFYTAAEDGGNPPPTRCIAKALVDERHPSSGASTALECAQAERVRRAALAGRARVERIGSRTPTRSTGS
jgi:hypothetical protein